MLAVGAVAEFCSVNACEVHAWTMNVSNVSRSCSGEFMLREKEVRV